MALAPPPVTYAGTLTNARLKSYPDMETMRVSNADIFRVSPFEDDTEAAGSRLCRPPKGKARRPRTRIRGKAGAGLKMLCRT